MDPQESALWQMRGKDFDASNRVGQKPQVETREIGKVSQALSVAPFSINVYRFPVVQTPD
jgi:hypothetical protein